MWKMAAPLYTKFVLRKIVDSLCTKSSNCLRHGRFLYLSHFTRKPVFRICNLPVPCRQMGFLGGLKWKGKKDAELPGPDDFPAEIEAYDQVQQVAVREQAPARKRQCIEEVRGYKPPTDVEDRLQALTEDVYGDISDWRNQPLNDRYKKYHLLTKAIREFDHDIPNFSLYSMSTVEDVVKYFQTEVRDSTKLEDLSKLDLPKNLHMNLEPIRFDPSTVLDGKSVFPEEKTIIPSVKYRRKYKGYEGKVRWK